MQISSITGSETVWDLADWVWTSKNLALGFTRQSVPARQSVAVAWLADGRLRSEQALGPAKCGNRR